MPELSVADVTAYTSGRLVAGTETTRLLAAALAAARKYCGWHVMPSLVGHVVTVDGSNDAVLPLPTLSLTTLTSVVEDGVTLSVPDLVWSTGRTLRKRSGVRWTWKYGAVVVTMTHGFTTVPDWDAAVLAMIDEMSLSVGSGSGGSGGVKRNRVDDVEREWFTAVTGAAAAAATSVAGLLDQYRLTPLI